jgi:hypothetical protein
MNNRFGSVSSAIPLMLLKSKKMRNPLPRPLTTLLRLLLKLKIKKRKKKVKRRKTVLFSALIIPIA